MVVETHKRCPRCAQVKLLNAANFAHNSRTTDGWWCYCKPCEKERMAGYRQQKREAIRANKRDWAQRNADRVKAMKQKTYAKHRERILAARRERYRLDPAYRARAKTSYMLAAQAYGERYAMQRWRRNQAPDRKEANVQRVTAWRRQNPIKARALLQRRRVSRARASGTFTERDIERLMRVQHGSCCYCKALFSPTDWTIEHLTPLSRGGSNAASNLALACQQCNSQKGNKTPMEYQRFLSMRLNRLTKGVANYGI